MNRLSKSNKFDENFHGQLPGQKSYNAITADISVTVWPEFVDNKTGATGEIYIWAYQVLVENKKDETIQIMKRSWKIVDEKGVVQEITGDGVVGEQPIILPNASFQYSSGVHLTNPSGIMSGKYFIKKIGEEKLFEIEIPPFSLDVPSLQGTVN